MKSIARAALSSLLLPALALAQNPASGPAEPASPDFHLRILELKGRAFKGAATADPKQKEGWTQLKVGDQLGRGDQLSTSLRSTVKLVLEPATPPTIIVIDRATLLSIDELVGAKDAAGLDSVVTRLGLAYGSIKAGVAEGKVRSDMVIESPVATLAKRGTWGFSFYVERGTGRFEMWLADRGIIEALQLNSGLRVTLLPGQSVDQLMSKWIDNARFLRTVNFQDWKGLKGDELAFLMGNPTGLSVLSPGGDPIAILNFTGRQSQEFFAQFQTRGTGLNLGDLFNLGAGQNGVNGLGQFGFFNLNDLFRFLPRRLGDGNFGVGGSGLPPFNPNFNNNASRAVRGAVQNMCTVGNALRRK